MFPPRSTSSRRARTKKRVSVRWTYAFPRIGLLWPSSHFRTGRRRERSSSAALYSPLPWAPICRRRSSTSCRASSGLIRTLAWAKTWFCPPTRFPPEKPDSSQAISMCRAAITSFLGLRGQCCPGRTGRGDGTTEHQLLRVARVVGVSARPHRPGTPVTPRLPTARGTYGVVVSLWPCGSRPSSTRISSSGVPAAHACGEQAVGYSTGNSVSERG